MVPSPDKAIKPTHLFVGEWTHFGDVVYHLLFKGVIAVHGSKIDRSFFISIRKLAVPATTVRFGRSGHDLFKLRQNLSLNSLYSGLLFFVYYRLQLTLCSIAQIVGPIVWNLVSISTSVIVLVLEAIEYL